MHRWPKFVSLLLLALAACCVTVAAQDVEERSLGDIAREAREAREKRRLDVQVTPEDAKAFFASVDEILNFASQDTGFPTRGPVQRRLVGREHVRNMVSEGLGAETQEKLARSELVLKKFGLLPADFMLRDFLVKNTAQHVAGYYDFRDKTMYLLNWVPLELQRPIMAHELTHALQDQNYSLSKFSHSPPQYQQGAAAASTSMTEADEGEFHSTRAAVVEGQAMVVFIDYLLKPTGLTLANSPRAQDAISVNVQSYDLPLNLHGAPRVLRESTTFPYREGLGFEVELLRRGGRQMAFAGALTRPPANTHQILHPEAYLEKSATGAMAIPDLRPVLGAEYEIYDRGMMGELDARIMAQEFGRENDLYTVAATWNGGGYVAVKRAGIASQKLTPSDISLLYISRWKTAKAAKRFAEIYKAALAKRENVERDQTVDNTNCMEAACSGGTLWSAKLLTNQGTSYLEILPGNTVFIAQGFEEALAARLRQQLLNPAAAQLSPAPMHELSLSLYESVEFRAFHEQFGDEWKRSLVKVIRGAEASAEDGGGTD